MKRDHSGKCTLNCPVTDNTLIHRNILTANLSIFSLRFKSVQVTAWNSCIGLSFTLHLSVEMLVILKILKPKYGTNKLHSCNSNQIFFTKTNQQNGPFPHRTSHTGTSHTKHLATFARLAPLYYCYYYYFIIIIILQLNYMNACHQ